jgi:hypothetical protein
VPSFARPTQAIFACAAALALAACGGGGERAAAGPCARAGFAGGSSGSDGLFFAVVARACARGRRTACTIADGTGPIERELVERGLDQSCVAFNQFVGSGSTQIPGYVTGECFGRAEVSVAGRVARRLRFAPRRCRVSGPRSRDPGPPRAILERPVAGSATVEGSAPDPWGRAPESGSVGGRPLRPPPWAVLVWRARDGVVCFEAGQRVGRRTPGRSDQLPGVRPTGRSTLETLVGSLRYDSRSGTGIQFYGLGRFAAYPVAEGGTCGDPAGGAGLLLSRTTQWPRRDLSLGHTIVAGVAGPRVEAVNLRRDGRTRRLALSPRRRAFVAVVPGVVAPGRLVVIVRYAGGATRRFDGS